MSKNDTTAVAHCLGICAKEACPMWDFAYPRTYGAPSSVHPARDTSSPAVGRTPTRESFLVWVSVSLRKATRCIRPHRAARDRGGPATPRGSLPPPDIPPLGSVLARLAPLLTQLAHDFVSGPTAFARQRPSSAQPLVSFALGRHLGITSLVGKNSDLRAIITTHGSLRKSQLPSVTVRCRRAGHDTCSAPGSRSGRPAIRQVC
jgi:hypothetical protein